MIFVLPFVDPDPSVSVRVKRSFMCRVLHRFFCQCFHLDGNADEMDIITKAVRDFQRAEKQLVGHFSTLQ